MESRRKPQYENRDPSIFFLLALLGSAAWAEDPKPKHWSFKEMGRVPTLNAGRMKPFDSYARETVLFITGAHSLPGWDPMDLFFSWLARPDYWSNQPIIKISNHQLLKQLLLSDQISRFSPRELIQNPVLIQYAQEMGRTDSGLSPKQVVQSVSSQPDPREQELKHVLDRLSLYRAVTSGAAIQIVPVAGKEAWENVAQSDPLLDPLRRGFLEVVKAYYDSKENEFESKSARLREMIQKMAPGWNASIERKVRLESLYDRARPFRTACTLYLLAGILLMCSLMFASPGISSPRARLEKTFTIGGQISLAVAFLSHLFGFALRVYIAGRPPVSNMYESVAWVSFGVLFFSFVIFGLYRQRVVLSAGALVGGLILFAADSAPAVMDPSIHTLVPVLRSNYWLTIHVLTITLGYAAFALSLGISNASLYQYLKGALGKVKSSDVSLRTHHLGLLSYRAMQFGTVLLAAGTILGGVWADYSWGRFWGWDPKETWALIALLCYLAVLHGRYAGWVRPFGFAMWGVICFMSVLMAWYGVNFVLGVGLHSYGFSSGGISFVLIYMGIQLAFVFWVLLARKIQQSKSDQSIPT